MSSSPADASWTIALHDGPRSNTIVGAGIVVDSNLVLTCAHVARPGGLDRGGLWVSFPLAGVRYWERRPVGQCLRDGLPDENIDLALLELTEPVPAAVTPARLRCLPQRALTGRQWWALGFPQSAPNGSPAQGQVSDIAGWGKVHLTSGSGAGLAKGFSGTALWSPEYRAVVGIVEQAHTNGNGLALTFEYADAHVPDLKLSALAAWRLADADDGALAAWGWSLTADDEQREQHWLPRARGVAVRSERGYRFRGRTAALNRLIAWLDQPEPTGCPLVLTGSPGVGKSAVLGRIITTADPQYRSQLPPDDNAVRARPGSVSCAVHAKGKSALDVAVEIARAAGVRLPRAAADELPPTMRDGLAGRSTRFNLIVDALDEAATPEQARRLLTDVLLPLARTGAHVGIQVAVGTRRHDDAGDLLALLGTDPDLIDLDQPAYFDEADLVDYATACLLLVGEERPENPFPEPAITLPVARRVAELARGNFLIAGLLARTLAARDTAPADPGAMQFTGGLGAAIDTYLTTLPPAGTASARLVLTALAYSETPGLPLSLWRAAVEALGAPVTEDELESFCRSRAANFLVASGGGPQTSYRLFHQALNDELRSARGDNEARLVAAWSTGARAVGWSAAPEYLLRNLAEHAARTGQLDDLLADDGFLLHARLDRVLRVTDAVTGGPARARAQLLSRTNAAIDAPPAERAALFSVADHVDGLGARISTEGAPYHARWAHTVPRQERTVLEGHSDAVYDVCPITVDGRILLASAGEDGTVRLWDPRTHQAEYNWRCHEDCVRGLCAVRAGTELLLATASHDGSVRLWDPVSGVLVRELRQHEEWVRNICTIPLPGGDLLASAGDDGTTRVWDPATGALLRTLDGHAGWVTAVTHVPMPGRQPLLASTGYDGMVRLWDPVTGAPLLKLTGHEGWVTTLYAVRIPGGTLVASAGYDGTVRLWDPRDGREVRQFRTPGPLTDLCTIETASSTLLVATGEDGAIRLWRTTDWSAAPPMIGHFSWIRAVCELPLPDRRVLATAGDDGTVRLWDPESSRPGPIADGRQLRAVSALCTVQMGRRELVVSAGGDGSVRRWDPDTGEQCEEFRAETGTLNDVCVAGDEDGSVQIVAANSDGSVVLWDADDPTGQLALMEHFEAVNAVCTVPAANGTLVASAGEDLTIRLWTPHDHVVRARLTGHSDWVTALVAVPRDGGAALASADKTGSVRLWDTTGDPLWQVGHSDAVNALCVVTGPGGPLLASACADGEIRLWAADTGCPSGTLSGHGKGVTGLTTMPYGKSEVVVSTSLDRTVRLWDAGTARAVRTIPVHHPALSCHLVGETLIVGLSQGLLALAVGGLMASD